MKLRHYEGGLGYEITIKDVAFFHDFVRACLYANRYKEQYQHLKTRGAVVKSYKNMIQDYGGTIIDHEFFDNYDEHNPLAESDVNKLFPELKGGVVE